MIWWLQFLIKEGRQARHQKQRREVEEHTPWIDHPSKRGCKSEKRSLKVPSSHQHLADQKPSQESRSLGMYYCVSHLSMVSLSSRCHPPLPSRSGINRIKNQIILPIIPCHAIPSTPYHPPLIIKSPYPRILIISSTKPLHHAES